jgi:hypothetical protein
MTTGTIIAIVVVVVVTVAIIAAASAVARRRRLQQRFGPEYDLAVADTGSRRRAEAELTEREKRVSDLDIRPLDPAARDRYAGQWTAIQQQFVDSPANAITEAQTLIAALMNERGYPTEDTEQIIADLSVDHAATLRHFRTAQDLSARAADGSASTEDMRQAMVHYRTLFRDLLGEPAAETAGTAETTAAGREAVTADDAGYADAGYTDTDAPTHPDPISPDEIPPSRTAPHRTVPNEAAPNGTAPAGRVRTETQEVPAYTGSDEDAEYSRPASVPPAPRRPQER